MRHYTIYTLMLTLLLNGCIRQVHTSGHALDAERLSQVHTNYSNRDSVFRDLGSPSAKSEYGEEVWYYIFSEFEKVAFLKPKITKQTVVALTFNEDGIVQNIESYDAKDAHAISIATEKTTTGGHSLSIIEQLLGNVGRFNTK